MRANRYIKRKLNEQQRETAAGLVCSGELDERFRSGKREARWHVKEETKQNETKQDSMGKDEMKQDAMGNGSMKHDAMAEGSKRDKAHKSKKSKKDAMGKDQMKHDDNMEQSDGMTNDGMQH
jgi:hypothetical protein